MSENRKNDFLGFQTREMPLGEMRVIDDEQRTVELSFSSETPVRRWYGEEILSHKAGAVVFDRLKSGGCLLFNHNRDKVIGRIIEAKVKNKRGIATVQFDDDEESLLYFRKVQSGTLKNTSVGYIIHEAERNAVGKGEDIKVTYTATRWEPYEISIVTIPADISVGVGRSAFDDLPNNTNTYESQIKINKNKFK